MDYNNNEPDKDKKIEDELKDALTNTSEREIRFSRESSDYVYSDGNGNELSLYSLKTMNIIDMQIEPSDDKYYDFVIDEHTLAECIEIPYKSLHHAITKGKFIWELLNSKFIDQELNEKGERVFLNAVNVMSSMKYDDKEGKIYFRKNQDMSHYQLLLGSNKPYYANNAKLMNSLKTPKKIELYRLIEDELSYLQYKLGLRKKYQMLNDHRWHEISIPIIRIRKKTFTLDKYPNNNVFVSTFIKRQLEEISETTDIEIDTGINKDTGESNFRTNEKGTKAEFLILMVRRKENNDMLSLLQPVEEDQEDERFFEDDELNESFTKYLSQINCLDINKKILFKKRLIQCVNDSLGTKDENINIDIAIRIIEYSARKDYKDFFPIKKEEVDMIKSNESRRKTKDKLKEIEDLYMTRVED